MAHDNSIEAQQLVREFKKGPRAVDGIDLRVEPGEIYGFLGPNGAGKSTTVLMLTTLLPPTAGTARVGGYDVVREGPKVRSVIGAALQEAALDPLLTGRDHLRLQATLQGAPARRAEGRGDELLERVGLTEAADRKVRGYSGGMKRRLDLALALVHRPQHPLPRRADDRPRPAEPDRPLGGGRAARAEDGVTVFLTTQYLEEADVLADRVGIIDHGRIVAEGTPAALKAEIGRPSVQAIPAEADERRAASPPSSRASASRSRPRRDVAVRLEHGDSPRRRRPRARRRGPRGRGHRAARAVARRRVPREDRTLARGRRGRGRRRRRRGRARRVSAVRDAGRRARAALGRPHDPPAGERDPAARLPGRADAASTPAACTPSTELPGFPTDSFVAFALAVPFIQGALFATMNAGTDLARDIQTGFLNRLVAHADAGLGAARRPARRRRRARARPGASSTCSSAFSSASDFASGVGRRAGPAPGFAVLVSFGFGALGAFLALRTGSGEAVQGMFPALFVFLFLSSMNTPRDLIEVDWFRYVATVNPVSYLIECVRSLIIDGLGRPGARARLRRSPR